MQLSKNGLLFSPSSGHTAATKLPPMFGRVMQKIEELYQPFKTRLSKCCPLSPNSMQLQNQSLNQV